MDILKFVGIFLVLFLYLFMKGIMDNKREKEHLKEFLKANYGKKNERKWKTEEIERISRYATKRENKYTIDSLTWNDLDMDEIFKRMAYTHSSIGDDYLYFMLKNPKMELEELLKLEKKISYFQQNEAERVKIQVLFQELGRTTRYSLSDYLEYLQEIVAGKNGKHYTANLLLLTALLFMIYNTGWGLVLFFLLIFYQIASYFKEKAVLDLYLKSFRYILQLLQKGKELSILLPTEWSLEKAELEKIEKDFRNFQKHSYLVMSSGRMSGNGFEVILDYLRMCLHLDIIKFNQMLCEIQKHIHKIWRLYEIAGEVDACIAIGEYRAFLQSYCIPTFSCSDGNIFLCDSKFQTKRKIQMQQGYHPLVEQAVPNSVTLNKNMLLTGSNASGKSTFLKTMGVNVLLAQTIHTCLAEEFVMPMCRLYTSMSVKDSITGKESYYMAEIRAIKRILDVAKETEIVICMVDEVLRGTNTVERIAASTQILKGMSDRNIICLAATHDMELTEILEKTYENYHFEESIVHGDVQFSYQLKKGKANTRNAITLLEKMGYEQDFVEKARNMAEHFIKQGKWL